LLAYLLLKVEPVSKTLPLILKLFYSVELAKFGISLYFTTLHFSGLFGLYGIKKFSQGLCESQGT